MWWRKQCIFAREEEILSMEVDEPVFSQSDKPFPSMGMFISRLQLLRHPIPKLGSLWSKPTLFSCPYSTTGHLMMSLSCLKSEIEDEADDGEELKLMMSEAHVLKYVQRGRRCIPKSRYSHRCEAISSR